MIDDNVALKIWNDITGFEHLEEVVCEFARRLLAEHEKWQESRIIDETERTGITVVRQRAYTVPLDVANEISKLREQLAAERKAREEAVRVRNEAIRENNSQRERAEAAERRASDAAAVAMEEFAKECDKFAEQLRPSSESSYNGEDGIATACAEMARALIPDAARVEEILRDAESWRELELVAQYAGVDLSRYTIEWLIEPDTAGMKPFEKLRTLAYKDRIPVGTLLYAAPVAKADTVSMPVALPYIVEYARKDGGHSWKPMAAFDFETVAERYAADCANETWEYRVVLAAADKEQG